MTTYSLGHKYAYIYMNSCTWLCTSLIQQSIACYVIELNIECFRVRSRSGVAFAQGISCWRSQNQSQCPLTGTLSLSQWRFS